MSNLLKRAITGSIIVASIIVMLFLGFRVFTLFTMLLGLGLSAELIGLIQVDSPQKKIHKTLTKLGFVFLSSSCIGVVGLYIVGAPIDWPLLLLLLFFFSFFCMHVIFYKGNSLAYLASHFLAPSRMLRFRFALVYYLVVMRVDFFGLKIYWVFSFFYGSLILRHMDLDQCLGNVH